MSGKRTPSRADELRWAAERSDASSVFFFYYLSCHTHTHKRAERRARNIAGAEALAVARRPEVASREKKTAAAGIRSSFMHRSRQN